MRHTKSHPALAADVGRHRTLDAALVGEIIQMALSDHVGFEDIREAYGLGPDEVKALMRAELSTGSYRSWRRRVRRLSDTRAKYKQGRAFCTEANQTAT